MRVVSATEASRSFAAVLDEVERGGIVVVTRGGRRVATISPSAAANGTAVRELLRSADVDEDFATDVAAARNEREPLASPWPDD